MPAGAAAGRSFPRSTAVWDASTQTVTCLGFWSDGEMANAADAMGSTAMPSTNSVAPAGSSMGLGDPPQTGTPGGAAGHEYLRRKTKRDAEADALPLGPRKLARKLFDDPQNIRGWQSGERGEIAVAKVLDRLAADTIHALHDRRIPHSRANIDHIAIGPAGIYVIDAKRYVGQRVEVRSFGGLFSPRRSELFVGGRRKPDLVNGLAAQVSAVTAALSDVSIPGGVMIQPVLCFVDAEWSWLSGNLRVDGVAVVNPRGLTKLVQKPGTLDVQTRQELHGHLAERLPSMT